MRCDVATRRRALPPHAAHPVLGPSSPLPAAIRCMFWNAEYNAVAALPALFAVFLRDTQKVSPTPHPIVVKDNAFCFPLPFGCQFTSFVQLAVAVDSNRLISSAQLQVTSPSGNVRRCAAAFVCGCRSHSLTREGSAFSSPDIAAVGEIGAVRARCDAASLLPSCAHSPHLALRCDPPSRPCACLQRQSCKLRAPWLSQPTCSCPYSSTACPSCCRSTRPLPTPLARSR